MTLRFIGSPRPFQAKKKRITPGGAWPACPIPHRVRNLLQPVDAGAGISSPTRFECAP